MKDQHGNDIPNYFEELNKINVNDKVEKKNGLSYLSWPYAWGELKKKYPEATFTIYENAQGWNYLRGLLHPQPRPASSTNPSLDEKQWQH